MVDFRKWLIALAAVGLLLGIGSSTADVRNEDPTCQGRAAAGLHGRSATAALLPRKGAIAAEGSATAEWEGR